MATVSILDSDKLDPGTFAISQLHLESPVTAVWGQPFVIRDASAEHTLGGGTVLQPAASRLRRRHTETLTRVEQLAWPDPAARAGAAAWASCAEMTRTEEVLAKAMTASVAAVSRTVHLPRALIGGLPPVLAYRTTLVRGKFVFVNCAGSGVGGEDI